MANYILIRTVFLFSYSSIGSDPAEGKPGNDKSNNILKAFKFPKQVRIWMSIYM